MRRVLLVVAGALAVQLAGVFTLAGSAQAAPRHVGVVVRYADGNVSAGCAAAGGSGLQVLEQHHAVTMGTQQYSGFVLKVDGVGTSRPDDTHYWSYWHSGGNGTWRYASSGASSYTPPAGTVEGWSYVDGQSQAPPPPSYTYSSLCGNLDPKPSPKPSPKPRPAPTHRPSTHRPAPAPTRTTSPTPVTHSRATYVPPSAPRTHHRTAHAMSPTARAPKPSPKRTPPRTHRPAATRQPAGAATSGSPTATATPASSTSPVAQQTSGGGGGFPAWGTVLALGVVAVLGATALLVMRRRAE